MPYDFQYSTDHFQNEEQVHTLDARSSSKMSPIPGGKEQMGVDGSL